MASFGSFLIDPISACRADYNHWQNMFGQLEKYCQQFNNPN
jgi:hypothetical protein